MTLHNVRVSQPYRDIYFQNEELAHLLNESIWEKSKTSWQRKGNLWTQSGRQNGQDFLTGPSVETPLLWGKTEQTSLAVTPTISNEVKGTGDSIGQTVVDDGNIATSLRRLSYGWELHILRLPQPLRVGSS